MTESVLVIAPHPDDETLGCGGTLFRLSGEGRRISWLIVTSMSASAGFDREQMTRREEEIRRITELYRFHEVYSLGYEPAYLDAVPLRDLVARFAAVFESCKPTQVFLPHPADAHTDHQQTFRAAAACVKWFRQPALRRILAYETLSETEAAIGGMSVFHPNYFVNIEGFVPAKLNAMAVYQSECGQFPFPRSRKAIVALAMLRGVTAGFRAAEAFQLLREFI